MNPQSQATDIGAQAYRLAGELYPLCRSITGDGLRDSLRILQRHIPLEIMEVASGTEVYDWTVPDEWNIRDAWIKNAQGEKIIDFQRCNLHVVNYSTPVHRTLSLDELNPHLHSLPDRPDWIPYRTSYYSPSWGFCLSEQQRAALGPGPFEVCIDSTLKPGALSYGELRLPGRSAREVLISCHSCHPALANDNCAAMAMATLLAAQLSGRELRYSYRFLFAPGTIGAITWLARNAGTTADIHAGLIGACLGDAGQSTYKRSRRGDAEIDRAAIQVLHDAGQPFQVEEFSPYGYDERQYCSPGFNLPVGCLMRTPPGRYPEYHTSADDLAFISPAAMADSFAKLAAIVDVLETNTIYINTKPHCEPRLGKYGLYGSVGGHSPADLQMAMLWVLNLSDGEYDLLSIANRANMRYETIHHAATRLRESGLIKEAVDPAPR